LAFFRSDWKSALVMFLKFDLKNTLWLLSEAISFDQSAEPLSPSVLPWLLGAGTASPSHFFKISELIFKPDPPPPPPKKNSWICDSLDPFVWIPRKFQDHVNFKQDLAIVKLDLGEPEARLSHFEAK
jgi:hypothetical protein